MASIDPRLADPIVLALAARRAQARRQAPDWRTSIGLASLLEVARALPERDPWTLPSVEDSGSMARLLQEARQWEDTRRGS